MAFGVGAHDVGGGTIATNVVPAVLRVVLDAEDAGVGPKLRMADGVHDLAEGKVVVGGLGFGRRLTKFGAASMVVGNPNNDEIVEGAGGFVGFEVFDKGGGTGDVGDVEVKSNVVALDEGAQRIHVRLGSVNDGVGTAGEVAIGGGPITDIFFGIFPAVMSGGKFAEVGNVFAMFGGIIPNKARRRIGERITAGRAAATGRIAARPAGKFTFQIIRRDTAVGPVVAISAQDAATIGVIQQRKIADEFVFVGRDAFAKNT